MLAKSGAVTYGVVVAPTILVQGPVEVGPDCHCIVPVYPVSVSVTGVPAHTVVGETAAVPETGGTLVVMVTVLLAVQQPNCPPVTTQVYVVVVVGEATGLAMVVLLNPVAGLQR